MVRGDAAAQSVARWRTDIQGLRALAVLLVVLAHAGVPGLGGGVIGVDVFFVISGFLITGLLLAERERSGRISIKRFYARRARRLLPVATVVTAVTLAASYRLQPLSTLRLHVEDAVWSAGFLANVRFAATDSDYWASDALSPFRHYWSLAVEEQFYLLWPLVVGVFLARRARPAVWVALLAAGSLAFAVWHTADSPVQAYYSSPARAYELLIGALVAVSVPVLRELRPWLSTLLAVAGLAGVLGSLALVGPNSALPGWLALAPTLSAAALLAGGAGSQATWVGSLLSRQPLRYLGDISYSLYLWHWPVLVLGPATALGTWPEVRRTTVLLLVVLVLSMLSYHLVERPAMTWQWLQRVPVRALALWPASVAVVLVAASASIALAEAQLESRQQAAVEFARENPDLVRAQEDPDPMVALRAAVRAARAGAPVPGGLDVEGLTEDIWHKHIPTKCQAWWEGTSARLCRFGDADATRTIVLIGDSHAGMWLPAFDVLGKAEGFAVVPMVKHGCSPYDYPQRFRGEDYVECEEFRAWARATVPSLDPTAVVVTARGYHGLRPAEGTSREEAWSAAVTSTLTALSATAPRLLVLSDLPSRPVEAGACVTDPEATLDSCLAADSGTPETDSNVLTQRAAEKIGARYVSVTPLVCHDGGCPVVVGREFVYFDDDHVSHSWARRVAGDLGELLGDGLSGAR
ncbi:acyltransferase [Nocardioides sp. zg-ZUI104]|uniref:acyltransferase family protein n=1 Tax=Nocardioides faecalis TaxID=2803858 RepID=UPI001BCD454B|nr:acyltransferase family protein [Nocardioides faecalis]MBS4752734.1 acyltransferase [Nocardioides faecalis]